MPGGRPLNLKTVRKQRATQRKDRMRAPLPHAAIVGYTNAGKSSLLNALVNEERAIVHDHSGTTRDSIDVVLRKKGVDYTLVDTAGMRRRAKIRDSLEYYSMLRTDRAMQSADLVIMILDATELISDQDKKVIQLIQSYKRNLVLFINKWDLTEKSSELRSAFETSCRRAMPSLEYYPILVGSALERKGLGRLFETVSDIIKR